MLLRMRKICSMVLMGALLMVSSAPLLPAGMNGRAQAATYCPLCHMTMASMQHIRHVLTPAMRHCRIECCGHHDSDGLPHLLAPHAVSLADFSVGLMITDMAGISIPVLKPRLLPFPVPPPRFS